MKHTRGWLAGVLVVGCVSSAVAVLSPAPDKTAAAAGERPMYWTCEPLESDSLASAWLLERFVSPGCVIKVLPRGEVSAGGTPFDLPLVVLTRDRTRSTFQVIRQTYGLEDARLIELARQIDEIELRSWNSTPPETLSHLETGLNAAMELYSSPDQQVTAAMAILDEKYALQPSGSELTHE